MPLSLQERVNSVFNKFKAMAESRGRQYSLSDHTMVPPSKYTGILDNFLLPKHYGGKDKLYCILFDSKHKGSKKWKSSLEVKDDNFDFKPTQNFRVKGDILESGKENNFEYYFVKVKIGKPTF